MSTIQIDVDNLAIGYVADLNHALSFGLSWWQWKELFSASSSLQRNKIEELIPENLREDAIRLKMVIEEKWLSKEKLVATWLEELTRWPFPPVAVHISVVPFQCSQVPFPGLPLIMLGSIREGWQYPETIAHELAHIFFNHYTTFSTEEVHPLVQLIEEEVSVRLGHRPRYFAYTIPPGAHWVRTAQTLIGAWKDYLDNPETKKNIADLRYAVTSLSHRKKK